MGAMDSISSTTGGAPANQESDGRGPYRSLFEQMPLPAWVYDSETLRFLDVNQAALRRYGFSREEFLSMTILDIRPSEDVPALREFLESPIEPDKPRSGTWRHRARDGSIFAIESSASGIRFKGREATLVTAREIPAWRHAQEELRAAEEAFRALFDEAPVPYHEVDRNGVVVRVNRAECEVLRRPASEIIGRPIWELVSAGEREATRTRVARELREGSVAAPFERTYRALDGSERTFQVHERPIVGPAGEITGIRSAMLDLTESKKAARKIVFQAGLLDQVSEAVVAVDNSFRVVYWNGAAARFFGRSAEEVIGRDYGEAVQDAFDAREREDLRRQLVSAGEICKELSCRNRNGETLYVDLSATMLRDEEGRLAGAVGVHRDVTQRRKTEEALASSENRFNLAKTALGIGTWEFDLSSGTLGCSSDIARLYGITDDLPGFASIAEWLERLDPRDRERIAKGFEKVTREACEREYRVRWPDGSVHWIFNKSNVVFDENRKPVRVVGVSFDITGRKLIEDQLRVLSSAVEQSPIGILITDLAGTTLYANPKTSEVTGYSREELLGQTPRIFKSDGTSPEQHREVWQTIPEAVWRGVYQNTRKNGESFWEAATIAPIRDESGRVTHYLAVKEDITERRAMEAALKFSEERFRVAAESSGDVVYEWDFRTNKVQLLGCQDLAVPRDAAGRPFDPTSFFACIHEDDRARVTAAIQDNLKTGRRFHEEYRLALPGGGIRHWSDSGSALRDATGNPYKWVGVIKDVTETREAERANAELAAIVESSETAIFTRDLNSITTSWNAGAERIYGYSAAEMIGRDLRITVPPEFRDELDAVDARIRAGERVNHQETVWLTKGGARIEVMMTVSPVLDRSGTVVGAAHLAWEISELRNLQRQLAQAQKLESVGQLAAGIAHEINTPIQYIGDNAAFLSGAFDDLKRIIQLHGQVAEGLRHGPAPELANTLDKAMRDVDAGYLCEEAPKAISQLSEGVQQVARIVRAMKEFSHPGTAEKVMLDVNRAIESTVLVSRNEWKYVADVVTDLDPELPPVPCLAGEFNQVILNLVVNAAQAIGDIVRGSGRKGKISISSRADGEWAEIRVTDTGTGIPEAIRPKIFDPFFTTKEVGKGTGQGLAIAYNVIVKKLDGALFFETECGAGTTFVVRLPLESRGAA